MAALPTATADALDALAPSPQQVPSLDSQLGVILICSCFGCMLFGLTTHQTYRYFRLYPTDCWRLKAFVAALLSLDIFHTVLSIHICYFYLINNFFIPTRLLEGVWSIRLIIVETGCIIALAHSFYARRLFLLSGRQLWPLIVVSIFLLTELGMCIGATVQAFRLPAFEEYERYAWLICSAPGVAVLVDIFVTVAPILYLRRSRTGFKRTDSLVDVLMIYVINTGLSTSLVTLVAAVTAITMPHNLVYAGVYIIASKMYANSLLAVLNSRRSILDKGMEGFETGSLGMKVADPDDTRTIPIHSPHVSMMRPPLQTMIDVRVTTETFRDGHPTRDYGSDWNSISDSDKRPCGGDALISKPI